MKSIDTQHGFSLLAILIVIAAVGLISLAGYTVYDRQTNKVADTNTTQESTADTGAEAAPEVNSTEDLDTAEALLESTDTSSSDDAAELESEVSAF